MAPATKKLSIELPADLADIVASKVAMGDYANESEVIAESLSHLRDEAEGLEHWLRTEVVAAYDEARAHPENLISSEDMQRHIEEWTKATQSRR